MKTRIQELNELLCDDWEELSAVIHEMSVENVTQLDTVVKNLIRRNVELAEVSRMQKT